MTADSQAGTASSGAVSSDGAMAGAVNSAVNGAAAAGPSVAGSVSETGMHSSSGGGVVGSSVVGDGGGLLVGELVGRALAKGARRLGKAVGMVGRGEEDAIHQVRVSCRRLRSDLKLFRKVIAGEWGERLRGELAWLANSCGEARDLEVIAELVREGSTSEDDAEHVATILGTLTTGLERAAAQSAEVVLGERAALLVRELKVVAAAPELSALAEKTSAELLPKLLESARRKFDQSAELLKPWSPDDDWHEVRLLAKRVRYAADTSASVLGDEARDIAVQAARYQELLGQHQDHCAAADALTKLAGEAAAQSDVELSFTLGRLTERHRAARKPLREEFLNQYHRP
ncbi:CHAD domain-containing protein [Kribbella sp. NPDC051620]|uniref:CHAD domain-containing protein n=1 Tax=Kribbella sp. NPDC051620 TaxID=3364120 RepID=UPI0037AC1E2F